MNEIVEAVAARFASAVSVGPVLSGHAPSGQRRAASLFLVIALTPKYVPKPTPTTAPAKKTRASGLFNERRGCSGGGAAGGTGRSSSAGTFTTTSGCAGSTRTVVDHGFLLAARASMRVSAGSTGTLEPHAGRAAGM